GCAVDALKKRGLSFHPPGRRFTAGPVDGGPLVVEPNTGEVGTTVHAPGERDVFLGGRMPSVMDAMPLTNVLPTDGLGLPGVADLAAQAPALASQPAPSGQPTEALNAPEL